MQKLIRLSDQISVQVLSDALRERGIAFHVENAGMHALLPLPDVMDMQVMVEQADMAEAQRVVRDLELEAGDD